MPGARRLRDFLDREERGVKRPKEHFQRIPDAELEVIIAHMEAEAEIAPQVAVPAGHAVAETDDHVQYAT